MTHQKWQRDEIQEAVRLQFEKSLGEESLTADSNFFEIGGSSLLAVTCALQITKSTGLTFKPQDILIGGTPRGVAERYCERIKNG